MFIIFIGIFIFFGFATIFQNPDIVGSFGKILGIYNYKLFGFFAYVYPFLFLIVIFVAYKYFKKFDLRSIQFITGILVIFLSINITQAIFSDNGGFVGESVTNTLKLQIGLIGVWVFNIILYILSIVLIFEEKFFTLIKKLFKKNSKKTLKDFEIPLNVENFDDFKEEQKTSENLEKSQPDTKIQEKTQKEENFNEKVENIKQDKIIEQKPQIKTAKPKKLGQIEHLNEVEENKKLLDEIEKGDIQKPKDFNLPSLNLLNDTPKHKISINEDEIDQKISDLMEKLSKFKIEGDVVRTYSGPVVTTFEFKPASNIKVSRILSLQDDLAMALKASTIRIQAPIPGKDVVGIEIPNKNIETIYLKEILDDEIYKTSLSPLTIALGKDIVGRAFITDLKKLPHLLIAGTTGSGKSVGINAILLSLLYRNSPKTLRLVMIDPKMLEFSIYNDIPHLLTPVITHPKQALTALSNLVYEMERRNTIMSHNKTKNIESYNEKMESIGGEIFPYIVVIIDELADLMMTSGKDVEHYIARLAQMARASGIHLIVATQRPSVDVVTGLIKANLPSRISFRVGQKIDSKVILDQVGAESLLGRGDMLFTPPSSPGLVRLHAPFASESEIEKVVEFLKSEQEVVYDEKFLKEEGQNQASQVSNFASQSELDELFEEAKQIILTDKKTSISYLQRRLKIGYNRAATIIEQMAQMGILSEINSKGQRDILI